MSKNGLILLTPTSIAYTGTSATVSANGSVTFSACSSLSLNGVFSADYDNYTAILWWIPNNAGVDAMFMRLRASGTDNSTASSYTFQALQARNTTVNGYRTSDSFTRVAQGGANTTRAGHVFNFYGPYLAQPTAFRSFGCDTYLNSSVSDFAMTHNQSTAYDGFTITPSTGPYTGRIAVYGMRK